MITNIDYQEGFHKLDCILYCLKIYFVSARSSAKFAERYMDDHFRSEITKIELFVEILHRLDVIQLSTPLIEALSVAWVRNSIPGFYPTLPKQE
jgi:hypothetical protein